MQPTNKRTRELIGLLSMVIIFLALAVLPPYIQEARFRHFVDPQLKEAVKKAIAQGKSFEDVERLTITSSISTLKGIERLPSLKTLAVSSALSFRDIKGSPSLKTLKVSASFTSLDGIECLTQLTHLKISNRNQSLKTGSDDLSPLSKLKNLESLDIQSHGSHDLSFLNGLVDLQSLHIVIPRLEGVEVLSNLHNLRVLHIDSKDLKSIPSLTGLQNLESLILTNTTMDDLSFLQDITNLHTLDLSSNEIEDLSPLGNLKNLANLTLDSNKIANVSPLGVLNNLVNLSLNNNEIVDIVPLSNLSNLVNLSLNNNEIVDIAPLSKLNNLVDLSLNTNLITDVSPLGTLVDSQKLTRWLGTLDVGNNPITNLQTILQTTSISNLNAQKIDLNYVTLWAIMSFNDIELIRNRESDDKPKTHMKQTIPDYRIRLTVDDAVIDSISAIQTANAISELSRADDFDIHTITSTLTDVEKSLNSRSVYDDVKRAILPTIESAHYHHNEKHCRTHPLENINYLWRGSHLYASN